MAHYLVIVPGSFWVCVAFDRVSLLVSPLHGFDLCSPFPLVNPAFFLICGELQGQLLSPSWKPLLNVMKFTGWGFSVALWTLLSLPGVLVCFSWPQYWGVLTGSAGSSHDASTLIWSAVSLQGIPLWLWLCFLKLPIEPLSPLLASGISCIAFGVGSIFPGLSGLPTFIGAASQILVCLC